MKNKTVMGLPARILQKPFVVLMTLWAVTLPELGLANVDLRVLREEKELFEANQFQKSPGLLELQPEIVYVYDPVTKQNSQVRIEVAVLLQETNKTFREIELRAEILAPLSQELQKYKIPDLVSNKGREQVVSAVIRIFGEAYPGVVVENCEIKALVVQNDEMFPS